MDFAATQRADGDEKVFVQHASEAVAAPFRIHAHEVDVGEARVGLGDETDEERFDGIRTADRETRPLKVLEEQARKQRAHGAVSPPLVDAGGDGLIVGQR